jgi:hypothetical protein
MLLESDLRKITKAAPEHLPVKGQESAQLVQALVETLGGREAAAGLRLLHGHRLLLLLLLVLGVGVRRHLDLAAH